MTTMLRDVREREAATIEQLLQYMVDKGGSDLHLSSGSAPKVRIDGELVDTDFEPLDGDSCRKIIYGLLSTDQIAKFV